MYYNHKLRRYNHQQNIIIMFYNIIFINMDVPKDVSNGTAIIIAE